MGSAGINRVAGRLRPGGAFLIAVPLASIAQGPMPVEVKGAVEVNGDLNLESKWGLDRPQF